jgi:xanthine dehydrogenase accessory factor
MTLYEQLRSAIVEERPVCVAAIVAGASAGARMLIDPETGRSGSLGDPALDAAVQADGLALLAAERSEVRNYEQAGSPVEVFLESYAPPPHLIIVGAVHIAVHLCVCAKELGFRVTVVDPRPVFATRERFPAAGQLLLEWPDEALGRLRLNQSTYVAVLTHDPKLDDPAVQAALARPVRYVGAIGSRATQEQRRERLRGQGVAEADLARLHGPIGLQLGGRQPAEIAISILAEMIAVRYGEVARGEGRGETARRGAS